jgi:hypothetical protein
MLDKALTFDVNEVLPVGQRGLKPARANERALSAENRQLLDPATNCQTKFLEIDRRELPSVRTPRPVVSVVDNSDAFFTHRFSEVRELDTLFSRAASPYLKRRDLTPSAIKSAINEEVRRLIAEDGSEEAKVDRAALGKLGFEHQAGRGYTMVKGP